MVEDVYVCEGRRWYGIVALVDDYLLVYFLLGSDVSSGSTKGYNVDVGQCWM